MPAADGKKLRRMMNRLAVLALAVLALACAPVATPPPQRPDLNHSQAYLLALSKAVDDAPSVDAKQEIERALALGYSSGALDGRAFGYRILFKQREVACSFTVSELIPEAGDAQRLHSLAAAAADCSAPLPASFANATIPGDSYPESRLRVSYMVSGHDLGPFITRAFDLGYNAGVQDETPRAEAVTAAIQSECNVVLKTYGTSRDHRELCSVVGMKCTAPGDY